MGKNYSRDTRVDKKIKEEKKKRSRSAVINTIPRGSQTSVGRLSCTNALLDKEKSLATFKSQGKALYQSGNYKGAIHKYDEAILLYPKEPRFLINRGMCYKELKEWEKLKENVLAALMLDTKRLKPYHLAAISLMELFKKTKDMEKLKEAQEFLEAGLKLVDDLAQKNPESAKKFKHQLEGKLTRIKKFFSKKKLDYDMHIMAESVKCVKGLIDSANNNPTDPEELAYKEKFPDLLGTINEFIKERTDSLIPKYPDWLNCKITYELMNNPVLTPSGISYENSYLHQHFEKNGYFDPVTRSDVDAVRLVENKNLKEAYQDFSKNHPWMISCDCENCHETIEDF